MKNIGYYMLVAIALLGTSCTHTITEKETLRMWREQYNKAQTMGNSVSLMNTLVKFHNRKTPASQKEFEILWRDFSSTDLGADFATFNDAREYYYAAGKIDDLSKQANSLYEELQKLSQSIRQKTDNITIIKSRMSGTATKKERAELKSQTDDLHKDQQRFNLRKAELNTIIYGKGKKKELQDIGLYGWLKKYTTYENRRNVTRGTRVYILSDQIRQDVDDFMQDVNNL